ncbi:Uncharacterised protein [Mycobacteroides abscessus subsp. abscessus]|nr:Uncharacterised protein [Mycobacteroides abscessus subsp. abscessus]
MTDRYDQPIVLGHGDIIITTDPVHGGINHDVGGFGKLLDRIPAVISDKMFNP